MDDTQSPASPAGGSNQQGGPADQTANPNLVSNPPTVTEPVSPVSPPQKEQVEPVLGENAPEPTAKAEEWVKPSEVEPEIHPEVEQAGIEKVSELPEMKEEHKEAGIGLAKEAIPVQTKPTGVVQLPMTEKEADRQIKSTGDTDSPHWLAVLIKKLWKRLRLIH